MSKKEEKKVFQLSIACRKLRDRDVFSKSDPCCIVWRMVKEEWLELGRTEVAKDNLSPTWMTKFTVDKVVSVANVNEKVKLKFEVYDWDDTKSTELKKQEFLASLECTLENILAAPGHQLVHSAAKVGNGHFVLTAEEVTTNVNVITMQFAAKNLDKMDTFGKSDPYFIISRTAGLDQITPVHRSEVVKKSLNPTWAPFTISVRKLCNGDYTAVLKVDVFDHDLRSEDELIGTFYTSLEELSKAKIGDVFSVVNPGKQSKKKGYKNSGEVFVKEFAMTENPNFVDQ